MTRKASERYAQRGSPSATGASYLNLRIKSSKAFPMNEVGTIEELIQKVRVGRGAREKKSLSNAQTILESLDNNETLENNKDRRNKNQKVSFSWVIDLKQIGIR